MKAAVFHAPGDIRMENVPDPSLQEPTDAIVRITHRADLRLRPLVLARTGRV